MFADIKIFIVSWIILGLYWIIALVLCFWSTESDGRFWKRRVFIGLRSLPVFAFLFWPLVCRGTLSTIMCHLKLSAASFTILPLKTI